MSAGARFYFKPAGGEQVDTTIRIENDKSAAICGTVVDGGGAAVTGALTLLFSAEGDKRLIGSRFTDEEGQFFFGPIEGERLYLIKIYKNNTKIRELEIVAE